MPLIVWTASFRLPSVGAAPGVHDGVDALGQVEVGGADHHLVGAGEDHVGGDRAGGDVGAVLLRVGQVGEDRVATGPHVDRGSGRVVADGEPGLSGRDRRGVVDVRREHRLAGLVQVGDDGDVRRWRLKQLTLFDPTKRRKRSRRVDLPVSPIAGAIGRSSPVQLSSGQTVTSSPLRSRTGSASSPMRSFGPCRSAISAIGRPASASAARTRRARSACSSWVPCERLRRAASMPAPTSRRSISGDSEAGPRVATIFVRRSGAIDSE